MSVAVNAQMKERSSPACYLSSTMLTSTLTRDFPDNGWNSGDENSFPSIRRRSKQHQSLPATARLI